MLTYKAAYKKVPEGVHAEVLDFPGVHTVAPDFDAARRQLASELVEVAEATLLEGEPLPRPNSTRSSPESSLEEPIYLALRAGYRYTTEVR